MHYLRTDVNDPLKYPLGYFLLMGKSRSGHHFIKNNIDSWLNNKTKQRHYINLENYNIKEHDSFADKIKLNTEVNSINVMVVRDLLNWFTSFVYFTLRDNKGRGLSKRKYNICDVKHMSEWTPELDKIQNLVFIPNNTPKEDFVRNGNTIDAKFNINFSKTLNTALDNWLEHEKEFNSDTNYLNNSFIKLSYDSFVIDKEYRINICEQMGGVYNEDKLNTVPKAGRGSSFDFIDYDGKGTQMKVLERYKQWKPEHLKYLDVLKNHEALQYYINTTELSDNKKLFIDSL